MHKKSEIREKIQEYMFHECTQATPNARRAQAWAQEICMSSYVTECKSKFKRKWKLFECEGRVLRDNITKSGLEMNK